MIRIDERGFAIELPSDETLCRTHEHLDRFLAETSGRSSAASARRLGTSPFDILAPPERLPPIEREEQPGEPSVSPAARPPRRRRRAVIDLAEVRERVSAAEERALDLLAPVPVESVPPCASEGGEQTARELALADEAAAAVESEPQEGDGVAVAAASPPAPPRAVQLPPVRSRAAIARAVHLPMAVAPAILPTHAAPVTSQLVDVDIIAGPDNRFRCVPYKSTISARICVIRQLILEEGEEIERSGKRRTAKGYTARARANTCARCGDCELGRRVVGRLGTEAVESIRAEWRDARR